MFLAAIVFLVGAVITSQTLMAAVAGSVREYATLNALGVGVRDLRRVVLEQAFWVGGIGLRRRRRLTSLVLMLVARSQDVPVALDCRPTARPAWCWSWASPWFRAGWRCAACAAPTRHSAAMTP